MSDNVAQATGAESVEWDLSDLYAGVDDPALNADLAAAAEGADRLAKEYRGRVAELDAEEMRDMLEQYEQLVDRAGRVASYAYMHWSTNTEDAARGALQAKINEEVAQLQKKLVFLELEWANAPEDRAQALIGDPVLAGYRHWLEVTRHRRPYLLTEPEEKIMAEKQVTGRSAWSRFFDEVHSAHRYEWNGEQVPAQVVLTQLYNPDRDVRRRAAETLTAGLGELLRTTTYITNTLLADKAADDRLRGYPTWVSARNLSNEVSDEAVEALVAAVTGRYEIVERYYNLKARLLGIDDLKDYDRYAPLPAADVEYTWQDAQQIVLEGYGKFHPRLREIVGEFFERRWIDAPVRPGKLGGAYSHGTVPSAHPYIFMNFEAKPRDVMTLAHELGHGIHQYLSREQGALQADTPLTTAETASVFGEMLIFQDMMEKEEDPAVRLAMLTGKLEDSFATVFRQIAMNRFEQAMHTARREQGELTPEQLGEMWLETQRAMFGGSVEMTDDYGSWWSYIPHFVSVPGYVYAYAFGELLVLALYARYEEVGSEFADAYIEMLAKGGSDWPGDIVKPLGVDLSDPDFWQQGLDILDEMVSEAEALADQIDGAG